VDNLRFRQLDVGGERLIGGPDAPDDKTPARRRSVRFAEQPERRNPVGVAVAPEPMSPHFRRRVRRYVVTNLAAILPAVTAAMVFVVAQFVLILPTDCAKTPVLSGTASDATLNLGNPVFCGPDGLVAAAFDAAWRHSSELGELTPYGTQVPPDTKRAVTLLADQRAIFKEAKARLLWLCGFGVKLSVCILVIFGLLWVFVVEVEDFWFDQRGRLQGGWSLIGLPILIGLTFVCAVGTYLATFYILREFMFAGLRSPQIVGSWFHAFDDAVLDYVANRLVPAGHQLIDFSDWLVTAATIVIGLSVTMTLYQHPTQSHRRATKDDDPSYEEFLTRCFQRLMVCIYAGATLLVVSVGEIGARYSWPAALIGEAGSASSADLDPAYKSMGDSFSQLASQFQLGYGLLFTLFLAALFFPAWTILRRRAWQLVRTVNISQNPVPGAAGPPSKPSPADQEKWLTDHKMAFTTYQQLSQFIAILAPAAVGSLAPLLKLLGGS
jgi:hypothetical protein